MRNLLTQDDNELSAAADAAAADALRALIGRSGRGKDASTRFFYTGAECRLLRLSVSSLFAALYRLQAGQDAIEARLAAIEAGPHHAKTVGNPSASQLKH